MSDPKSTPEGERASEELSPEEAVARANEGLADAEAAGREAVAPPVDVEAEPVVVEETVVEDELAARSEAVEEVAVEEVAWYDRPLEETPGAAEPVAEAAPVAETVIAPVVADAAVEAPLDVRPAPTEPSVPPTEAYVAPADTYVAPVAAQPIFVQAPEPPRPRGNRGAAGAIGLVAAAAFAVLFLGIVLLSGLLFGAIRADTVLDSLLVTLSSWVFWTPVVAFFIGFWLLGAILNRARWPHWVIWGLLVGVVSYGGYILGLLFQAPFWELTASEGKALLTSQAFAPYAIVSFVIGRELTVWFGAWVARRGRRMTELNAEAQREYERTLEAGPQLYQQ